MALKSGSRLGHYQILSSLGAGGMGEVYRAKDTKLGREVAIKLLLEEVSSDPDRLARFEREARVLASLNHPNIATLHGFETEEESFLVMELVEGETLADRLARGPIPVADAIRLFVEIAEGLEAAHEKGVIHRDLKPANIKVGTDGAVKILDFGLAKALTPEQAVGGEPSASLSPTLTLGATVHGEVLGTAAYMSPEQAQGLVVDRRADIWAFGCCLYEALVGERLFDAENAALTLARVLRDDPDFHRLPASTPGQVRRLLRRCLARDANERLRDVADLRLELREALDDPEAGRLASTTAADRRAVRLVPVAVALFVGGVAAWWINELLSPPAPPSGAVPVRAVLSSPPSEPIHIAPFQTSLAITPDGETVIYTVGSAGSTEGLYTRRLDELQGHRLLGAEGGLMPFVSPDGEWVVFIRGDRRRLFKVAIVGGPAVLLAELPFYPTGVAWRPDGTLVVAVGDHGLLHLPSEGGGLEVLAAAEPEQRYQWPDFLPSGNAALVTVQTRGGNDRLHHLAVLDLASGETKTLVPSGSFARYLPSGHLVYQDGGSLMAAAFDPRELEMAGSPEMVLAGLSYQPGSGAANFAVADGGTMVFATQGAGSADSSLVWVDREGRSEETAIPARSWQRPAISPDGSRLAIQTPDDEQTLWLWDFARETLSPLLSEGYNYRPLWHPSGDEIVYTSSRRGFGTLYRKASDGSGDEELVTQAESPASGSAYTLTPDGRFAITAPRGGGLALQSMIDGSSEDLVESEHLHGEARVSPDGRWLAYTSRETGTTQVFVRPFPEVDEGRVQISSRGGDVPRWSADSRELFYREDVSPGSGLARMMVVDLGTGSTLQPSRPKELFSREFPTVPGYDVDPISGRFLMVRPNAEGLGESQVVLIQDWFEELERLVPTG
jgi:serine/threonine-protein kinase